MNTILTIGHSDHTATHVIYRLQRQRVAAVVDVRSSPYSQRHPQFNRESLEASLNAAGLRYVFLGRGLGAWREEKECYVEGRADYTLISNAAAFQEGLRRVQQGLARISAELLWAEHDPLACHRTILVCRNLRDTCPMIQHIRRDGKLESNQQAELRLLKELGLGVSNATPSIIDVAYDVQGRRIAYTDENTHEEADVSQEEFHL